jgi:AcrR family transcriptional regulator
VPKLWNETIEAHRREVRDAILTTTAALVFEQGLRSVTMSQIAEGTGIGRATLYKYFPDVDAILDAWHAREISQHLQALAEVRDKAPDPARRVADVLDAFALISHRTRGHHDPELVRRLHGHEHVGHAQQQLRAMLGSLVAEAAAAGAVRDDVSPDELAGYCLHALGGAAALPSEDAVRRLVDVTLSGLRLTRPAG